MHKRVSRSLDGVARREFLRLAPAAGLAVGMASTGEQTAVERVTLDQLESAGALLDLEFTDAEHDLMRSAVEQNTERYAALRELDVPADTEPAIVFRPFLPGGQPEGPSSPGAPLDIARPPSPSVVESVESLAFEPVSVLATVLEQRLVTSTDLTRMYLQRLRRFGDELACVVTMTEELALAQAAEADQEIRNGRYRGPLHGVPWGAKDLFATRGVRTTWGAKPYESQVIDVDATVVQRLRAAGAVLVAKLSMGALAQGGVWFGGSTRNPWDTSRSSSGSSAGPAAATAAGLVGFSVGTETLGSIISPSAACGVTGLRPTYGRVSRHGAMALSWTMDKIGPMCRSVEDCALVFNAIYGSDDRDGTVVDAPFVWDAGFSPDRLRVAYIASEIEALPPEPRNRLESVIDALDRIGVNLEPAELPDFPADALRLVLNAESAAAFDDLTRSGDLAQLTRQEAGAWPNRFRSSRFVPAVEYIRAQRARTLLMREMLDFMERYDAFLSPSRSRSLTMTNLTGNPAVALKAGFSDGRPMAVMMTGRLYDEATLLQLAALYQNTTRWHTMHPPGFREA